MPPLPIIRATLPAQPPRPFGDPMQYKLKAVLNLAMVTVVV